MSDQALITFTDVLMTLMQLSIIVPMVAVWRWRRSFAAPIRVLSWYVYLSAVCSLLGQLFGRHRVLDFIASNYIFNFGFNFGKVILFGFVYYRVLSSPRLRRLMRVVIPVALLAMAAVFGYNAFLGMATARVAQCALLAGLAILYLDQHSSQPTDRHSYQDSIWLLSVGQLIYSSVTVTAFSLDYVTKTLSQQAFKYIFVAIGGLTFNCFLTLAFLRAKRTAQQIPVSA